MDETNRRDFLHHSAAAGVALWATDGRAAERRAPERRLPVVTLEGPPRERGLVHGKTLKNEIHELVERWKADLAGRYSMKADAFIKQFLQHTDYLPAMRKWTPELLDEISGIAQGAAMDFDTMLVFQLIDEYWVHGPGIGGEHCSALGIARRGDQPSYIAQNMDLEGFRDGFQTVLRIRQPNSALEMLVLTHAGLIALNGMNNRALGVCCNTLGQLAYCRDGLPVACVVRGLLQRETPEAAVEFLRSVKHASGQNYILGGPRQVFDYECSAGKVSRFTPASGPETVWHTNHPLVNDDYNPAWEKSRQDKQSDQKLENTSARLQSLQQRLGKEAPRQGLELIQATLAAKDAPDHPVCRPYRNGKDNFTFASIIMVLADKPELHVAPGPPDVHGYRRLT